MHFIPALFCYGDEENARIYAVHLTTANQSEIRRAYLVSVGQYFGGIFKIMLEYKVDTRYTGNSYCSKADIIL